MQPLNRDAVSSHSDGVLQEMSVGYANGIRVMSMTHTGEPGFMLYIPIEVRHTDCCRFWLFWLHQSFHLRYCSSFSQYALHVYNEVMSVGQKYGIRNAGYYALRSLRIEKFFAFWGQDLDSFTTPLECGREFRVKFDKVSFSHSSSSLLTRTRYPLGTYPECSNNYWATSEIALRTV